jgi:hypothetical protein
MKKQFKHLEVRPELHQILLDYSDQTGRAIKHITDELLTLALRIQRITPEEIFHGIVIEEPHPPEKVPERETPMSQRRDPHADGLD